MDGFYNGWWWSEFGDFALDQIINYLFDRIKNNKIKNVQNEEFIRFKWINRNIFYKI